MLKLLTIANTTNILVSIVQHEEETIFECNNLALIADNLDKKLINYLVDSLKGTEDFLHILSNKEEQNNQQLQGTVKEVLLTDFTLNGEEVKYNIVPRYTGEQHIITDDGIYEVNSIDLSLEEKFFRVNISGEYNDLQVVPKRGTSYSNLHSVMQDLLETKLIDFRTVDKTIEINKVKFELRSI